MNCSYVQRFLHLSMELFVDASIYFNFRAIIIYLLNIRHASKPHQRTELGTKRGRKDTLTTGTTRQQNRTLTQIHKNNKGDYTTNMTWDAPTHKAQATPYENNELGRKDTTKTGNTRHQNKLWKAQSKPVGNYLF